MIEVVAQAIKFLSRDLSACRTSSDLTWIDPHTLTNLITLLVRVSLDSSQLHEVERRGDDPVLLIILHRLGVIHDFTRPKVGRYTMEEKEL